MLAAAEAKRFLEEVGAGAEVQCRVLLDRIVGPNTSTAYGVTHGFDAIREVDDFRRQVPLVDYESVRPLVDRVVAGESGVLTAERVLAFFRTSGSLAEPKLIPVTPSLVRDKARAFGVFWELVRQAHPALRRGRMIANFGDGGRPAAATGNVPVLSETAFWNRRMHAFQARAGWHLAAVVREIQDPILRYYVVARLAMQAELHGLMCLNPSTLFMLCQVIDRHAGELVEGLATGTLSYPGPIEDGEPVAVIEEHLNAEPERARRIAGALRQGPTLRALWPELELAVCWQSDLVKPYLALAERYLVGVAFRDYITQSSECIMAIPLADGKPGGMLAYTCHFYEFIPESQIDAADPETLLPGELEVGEVYELVATTSGGLYRYRTGDCFRVTGFQAGGRVPLLEFLHRAGNTASMTGEKLTEFQVLEAGRRATQACGMGPSVFVCFPRSRPTPHYGVLLGGPGTEGFDARTAGRWLDAFEHALGLLNPEYADKRQSGRLGPPVALAMTLETLSAYRRLGAARGASEEQVKLVALNRTLDLDSLLQTSRPADAHCPV